DNSEILEFIDNGHTGTNFERPAVQELLTMVQAGKINCIIVKDYCAIIGLNQKDLENQGILA
ncbi:recombinase, partial [bacterium 210917-SL.2.15]|nr:recombinase [bacterium 210917-SL.2.15]